MKLLDNFEALGTLWCIEVYHELDESEASRAAETAARFLLDFDARYSRFAQGSLVHQINTNGVCIYDEILSSMYDQAHAMNKLTDGEFRINIGGELVMKGYGHGEVRVGDVRLVIKGENIIRVGTGMLDLGGIGKGYAIDSLAEQLKLLGLEYFLINGGGDIYVTSDNNKPVTMYIGHPQNAELIIGEFALKDQSFCASSSYARSWNAGSVVHNHLVTRDGTPVWAASYVVAQSATIADMLATYVCVAHTKRGKVEQVCAYMSAQYLVIPENGEAYGTDFMVNSLYTK